MFPESIAAIIIGIGIGMFFKISNGQNGMVNFLEFEPHTFFLVLLPPIMFQAGFSMHMPTFLQNIKTINMYAIFATIIASFTFGVLFYYGSMLTKFEFEFLDSLHFGCFISAIDPVATISIFNSLGVNDKIHMIVFGESTLNDAVAIALSDSVAALNEQSNQGKLPDYKIAALYATGNFFVFFFGSMLLGLVISAFASILFKKFDFIKYTWIECSLFGVLSYLPYILAEYFELSGILAIFTTGLIMRDWTFYSLGPLGKITVEFFIETMGYISENFVFAYLGISIPLMMVNLQWPLVIIGCISLVISRTVSVFIVSLVVNIFRKDKIPFSHQVVMSYGGLRGAVAFYLCLGINTEYKHLIIMTTICLIMFTIIGLGSTTACLLRFLDKRYPQDCIFQSSEEDKLIAEGIMLNDELQADPTLIQRFDENYAQKLFRRTEGIGEPNENEIHIEFGDQSDDVSQVSYIGADKDMEQLDAYFNRQNRGGDMSPFRTNTMKSNAILKRKETSIFGKYSGAGETPSLRYRAKTRNLSEGIAKQTTRKISEDNPFSKTTKDKGTPEEGKNAFNDLAKSRSHAVNKIQKFPSEQSEDANLPRISFRAIIDEENEGSDDDDSDLHTGKFNIKESRAIKSPIMEQDDEEEDDGHSEPEDFSPMKFIIPEPKIQSANDTYDKGGIQEPDMQKNISFGIFNQMTTGRLSK